MMNVMRCRRVWFCVICVSLGLVGTGWGQDAAQESAKAREHVAPLREASAKLVADFGNRAAGGGRDYLNADFAKAQTEMNAAADAWQKAADAYAAGDLEQAKALAETARKAESVDWRGRIEQRIRNVDQARGGVAFWQVTLDDWNQNFRGYGEFTKGDLELATVFVAKMTEAWGRVVVACEADQMPQAKLLQAQAEKMQRLGQAQGAWRQRLECRKKQANTQWTSHGVYAQEFNFCPPLARPEYDQAFEMGKLASEAWGRAAEAVTPEADPQKMVEVEAYEQAMAASARADLAGNLYESARRNFEGDFRDESLKSPAIQKTREGLSALQKQRAEYTEQSIIHDRRGRDLARQERALVEQLRQDYEAERRARQAAEEAKQEALRKGGKP